MLNSQVEIGSTFTGFGISLKTRSKFRYYDLCELRIFCCDQVKDASRVKAVGVTWLSAHGQSLFDYSINEQDM